MKNILKSLAVILFSALSIAQNLPNISTQTKGQLPINRLNAPGVAGLCLQTDGLGNVTVQTCASGGGSGTVTNFSAGDLAPLFTTSVSNPSTIPSLSFSLSTALAHKFFGNNTASTTSPDYVTIGNGDLPGSGGITLNTTAPITGGGLVTLGGSLTFACPSCLASVTAHNLLSATHGDTTTHTVLRGDLIAGIGAVPTWTAVAKGGTNAYPKWNASGDVIASTLAASGVGSPTACTNQAVTAFTLNADAAPTSICTTITSAFTSGTFPAAAHNLLSAAHGDTTSGSVVTGDVISGQSSAWARLAGNSTTTPQYLKSLGSGAAANAPSWAQVAYTDLSGVPTTFAPTAHNILSASHGDTTAASAVRGDGFFAIGATPTWQRLAHPATTGGYFKWNGTDIVASSLAASGTGNCGANQFETGSNADAAPTCAQPSFTNISGSVAASQMPALTGDVTSTAGTVATTLATVATPGTNTKITFNAKGLVTSGAQAVLASADYVNQGTTTTLLHGNAAGNPSFAGVNLINDASANQGTVNQLLHGNAAGQPSFSAVASADLNLTTTTCTNQFVTAISAGGVGTCTTDTLASAQHANQGTVNTVLHGNAAGNPAFSAVTSADTTGTFPATAHNLLSATHGDSTTGTVARGDIITGQGASPTWSRLAKGTANQVLSMDGTGTDVLWATVGGTGTVTNIATTSPITGGPITTTGTIACATCVTSTTPGAGIAHFAGSTQNVTSSAVAIGDVASSTGTGNFVFDTGAAIRLKTLNGGIMFSDEFGLGNWCDDVTAADTLLGTKGGEIWVTGLDGVFCSGPITIHNTIRFIDPGDYVTKGISIPVGGISIICNGLTNAGSSPFGTRLLYNGVGGQTVDGISILGTAIARLDKVNIEGCLFDGQQIDRYDLRVEKADGMTIKDTRFQGGGIANTYMVDAIDWKWFNVGSTFCQGPTGTGNCNIFDWGSGNGAWIGGQTEQGAASTGVQVIVSGAINNIEFIAQDWDATFATGGFLLVQGQNANSAFPGAPTGGTGRPINITLRDSLISTSVNPSQGSDILVTNATNAQQPANINISNVEFNGNSVSAIAVKADQAQNVKLKDSFSNGHTTATFSATANAVAPEMMDNQILDTARVNGTTASICDIWNTTGLENYNCNLVFNQQANKLGQADIVADSSAINTTETIIVKTPALAASRLAAGTHVRMTLTGTCTSSAANTSTFTIRMGTSGTTADSAIATPVTAAAQTSGTNIPFKAVIDFTVRTVGSSATGFITLELANQGTTGIATTTEQLIMPSMSTFNTTTANNILSVSYKSAASTTTSTFKQGVIEFIQN